MSSVALAGGPSPVATGRRPPLRIVSALIKERAPEATRRRRHAGALLEGRRGSAVSLRKACHLGAERHRPRDAECLQVAIARSRRHTFVACAEAVLR